MTDREQTRCAYCGAPATGATVLHVSLKEAALPREVPVSVPVCSHCPVAVPRRRDGTMGRDSVAPAGAQEEARLVGVV